MKVFADTISVNLNGAYYMSKAVFPYMPPGISSIINIWSTRALQSEPGTTAYSASKVGLCGLTHSLAITLVGRVRVNSILPSWINTDPAGKLALRTKDHSWHPTGIIEFGIIWGQHCRVEASFQRKDCTPLWRQLATVALFLGKHPLLFESDTSHYY